VDDGSTVTDRSRDPLVTVVMPTGRLLGGAERALVAAVQDDAFRHRLRGVVFLEPGDLVDEVARLGVSTEVLPFTRVRDVVGLVRTAGRLRRILRHHGTTVAISWMTKAAFVTAPAARLAGSEHVLYQHGPTSRSGMDRAATWLPVDHVLCCSDWAASSARQAWPAHKVATVYPPLPAETFERRGRAAARERLGLEQDATLVVMVSRWQSWKRVHLAIDAADAEDWPAGAVLVLVGGPVPTEPDYGRVVAARLGAVHQPGRVRSIGFHPEGRTWMAAADVALHLSEEEPFGLVLVEAAAAGTPMVTTAGGGAAELVDQLGNCVVAEATASSVARAVRTALERHEVSRSREEADLEERFGPSSWWRQLSAVLAH
jgi:glycosyltransferase involved in cell wall biosynthesis